LKDSVVRGGQKENLITNVVRKKC